MNSVLNCSYLPGMGSWPFSGMSPVSLGMVTYLVPKVLVLSGVR